MEHPIDQYLRVKNPHPSLPILFNPMDTSPLPSPVIYIPDRARIPTDKKSPRTLRFPHPTDPYIYVADLGADAIFSYHYNPHTAETTPLRKIGIPGSSRGPRHMKWAPNGKILYLLNELSLTLCVFSYMGNGHLQQIDEIDALPPNTNRDQLTAAKFACIYPIHPLCFHSR